MEHRNEQRCAGNGKKNSFPVPALPLGMQYQDRSWQSQAAKAGRSVSFSKEQIPTQGCKDHKESGKHVTPKEQNKAPVTGPK